jgi:hypothetical protein
VLEVSKIEVVEVLELDTSESVLKPEKTSLTGLGQSVEAADPGNEKEPDNRRGNCSIALRGELVETRLG